MMKCWMIAAAAALMLAPLGAKTVYTPGYAPDRALAGDVVYPTGAQDRAVWVDALVRIADPVLKDLSQNTFRKNFRFSGDHEDRRPFAYLETFGRLMCGLSAWLELGPDDTPEGKLRAKYIDMAVKSLENAVNPKAPDCMEFYLPNQSLVNAAFLAQGLLRAPKQLWGRMSKEAQANMVAALKRSRKITPVNNNWLLFASAVEAALLEFTGECDEARLLHGVRSFRNLWYAGDGMYGDGFLFHVDYYNGYVIHPMLTDVLEVMKKHGTAEADFWPVHAKRAARLACLQERLISPEGTYPVWGRSITYRFGALQPLSQMALMHRLPDSLPPARVRCAMTAAIARQIGVPGTFDRYGYLNIGFAGNQRRMGEYYISNASTYLCTAGLIALGLPPTDPFWSDPFTPWTNLMAWNGIDVGADHAIPEFGVRNTKAAQAAILAKAARAAKAKAPKTLPAKAPKAKSKPSAGPSGASKARPTA